MTSPVSTSPKGLRRYGVLSRLSSEIVSATNERDLVEKVTSGLEELFQPATGAGFFQADSRHGELVATDERASSRELLSKLINVLPAGKRNKPSMAFVAAPNIFYGARGALLSAPLIDRTTMLGVLVVERKFDGPDFGIEDIDALTGIAGQVCFSLQRLRAQRRHMSQDLDLARQIQQGFLQLPEEMNGFRVSAHYRPALNVGGDFYALVATENDRVMAVIGDVSGKGVSAALLMSRVTMEFSRIAKEESAPRRVLSLLNESLCQASRDDTFVTAACLRLDAHRGRLTVANAGHVLPVIRRRTGTVLTLGAASGLPIGMMPTETYADQTFDLEPGDIILLMTDGVVEALEGDVLDMRRVMDLVSEAPHDATKINDEIISAVERAVGARIGDDVALLSLELMDQAPPITARDRIA